MRKRIIRVGIIVIAIGAALFLLIQIIPIGPQRTNPPVVAEPKWDSLQTRVLAKRACFDCHSNEIKWPWYSRIAPVSWLLANDVLEGRAAFNFSDWHAGDMNSATMAAQINSGKMPLPQYLLIHPNARFTNAQKQQLIAGLTATLASETVRPPSTAPVTDGASLLEARCTVCHSIDRVRKAKKTRDQWVQNIKRMVSKGAQLNAAEQSMAIDYLSKTYGL
ncbi:MAG: heme-binding domain-containing protein [Syntrophales bacterium]|jgi:mono/diheme cytochrome c family protein|nr:heme-binding domain-containing protein [Syntrophales bacterium]MCK9390592.1 heme-binding domain-containing protein [Syntrophales bacterium]